MSPGVRENPWVGTRPVTRASIREIVDGGPPRDAGDLTGPALHAKQMEGVLEAYRARYLAPDGSRVDVYAVRFDDPKLTVAASLSQLKKPGRPGRVIVRDATAVRVLPGSGGDCFRAVADYIASMQ